MSSPARFICLMEPLMIILISRVHQTKLLRKLFEYELYIGYNQIRLNTKALRWEADKAAIYKGQ
jgi:hypothetical protein